MLYIDDSPQKGPVMRIMFPCSDVFMWLAVNHADTRTQKTCLACCFIVGGAWTVKCCYWTPCCDSKSAWAQFRPRDHTMEHDDIIKWKHFPRYTGALWGLSTGHLWIPLTKATDAELWCFIDRRPDKRLSKQTRRRYQWSPSHTGLATMLRPIRPQNKTNRRWIADKSCDWSLKSCVIVRAKLYAASRWLCSKPWTYDYKSQEVANRSHMIVRRNMQGRTVNRAWSWVDKSRDWSGDWLGDHAIGRSICGTVPRLVVRSITISDNWLHNLKIGRATSRHLLVVSYQRGLVLQ